MAEVLGVVASGIAVTQLAGQVTKSIIKLKEYWAQVQEAPDEIKYLLREVDSLSLILSHIQNDQTRQTSGGINVDNLCLRQSLELCREGAEELRGLADELAGMVDGKKGWRKKVGSVKVVLKKEDVKNLKRRMKNAIRLLSLSYQWHTNAMIQLQPDLIVTRMVDHIASLMIVDSDQIMPGSLGTETKDYQAGEPAVHRQYDMWISSPSWITYLFGQFEYHHRTRVHRGRDVDRLTARYTFPEFITNKVLDFQGNSTLSGWRLNIQTYRTIPHNNPFFSAIVRRDLGTVRQMLANKEYFVSDRDEYLNESALHTAVLSGDVEICKFLLRNGADPLACDRRDKTPFHKALIYGAINTFVAYGAFDVCRALVADGAVVDLLIDDPSILQGFHGSLDMLRYIHQLVLPAYRTQPEFAGNNRIAFAADFATGRGVWHNNPLLIEYWLDCDDFLGSGELAKWVNEKGQSFLHSLVEGYAYSLQNESIDLELMLDESLDTRLACQIRKTNSSSFLWRKLIRKLILAGCSASATDKDERTVLSTLVEELMRPYSEHRKPVPELNTVLRQWIEDLVECGVDLLSYSKSEAAHWKTGNWGSDCDYPQSTTGTNATLCNKQHVSYHHYTKKDSFYYRSFPKRGVVVSFSHGAQLEDWVFTVYVPAKAHAVEFWNMIEGDDVNLSCIDVPSRYEETDSWSEVGSSKDDDGSEDDEEESTLETVTRPVPGSWSQEFEE